MNSGYMLHIEHEEFAKRIEEEQKRQDRRIEEVEKGQKENNKLLLSVERLAVSMESMQKEQKDQGERLEVLENRDGEKWRKAEWAVISGIIMAVLGYILGNAGL
jgi:hypothetical protein